MSSTVTTVPVPEPAPPAPKANQSRLQWLDEIARIGVGASVLISLLVLSLLRAFRVMPDDPIMSDILKQYGTLAVLIVGFYYGSSSGSKTKSNTIANQIPPAPPPLPLAAGAGSTMTTIISPGTPKP